MNPTDYARSVASKGSLGESVQYYTSCRGTDPAETDIYNAEYASNLLVYFVNTLATDVCPDDASLQDAVTYAEKLQTDVDSIGTIAACAPYKEYWETFFNEGMCSDVFDGLYLIWITQSLTVFFLFAATVVASLMYPFLRLPRKEIELEQLGTYSKHPQDLSPHSEEALSGKNPMLELANAQRV